MYDTYYEHFTFTITVIISNIRTLPRIYDVNNIILNNVNDLGF